MWPLILILTILCIPLSKITQAKKWHKKAKLGNPGYLSVFSSGNSSSVQSLLFFQRITFSELMQQTLLSYPGERSLRRLESPTPWIIECLTDNTTFSGVTGVQGSECHGGRGLTLRTLKGRILDAKTHGLLTVDFWRSINGELTTNGKFVCACIMGKKPN